MAVSKDEVIKELKGAARQGRISCALALSTAFRCGVTPGEAGTCLDEQGIRIESCQLGLFGYGPGKQKRIQMPETISGEVADWMADRAEAHGHITCSEIFAKAKEDGLSRALLAGACEKTGVKIRACQLGAFF
ncbi:hypothetical protein [Desulfoluna spongiiphila]|uniref:Uncharacterized protein n=1 Tax=Desulfoluna spongiiphila TaxID=419481 RepID=A0A1G5GRA8_9BACT|nr:hypothetical protein [Desulfoluna spongiiphila]SCY54024.1 hypothetical protein SAMN05216233_11181 [Desulfoluna spongiiphila]